MSSSVDHQDDPSSIQHSVGTNSSSSTSTTSTTANTSNTSSSTSSATSSSGGQPQSNPTISSPNIQHLVASKRLQQAQAQVGEVVDIMRVNVEKVLERDSKLSELDRRADDLQEGASQFQQQAVKLKRKFWWENIKMWIILGIIIICMIVIIVISTAGTTEIESVVVTPSSSLSGDGIEVNHFNNTLPPSIMDETVKNE